MNEIKTRKCIVCLKEYEYATKGRHTPSNRIFRSRHSFTCQKKCSKVYARIYHKIIQQINKKFELEDNA